MKTGSPEIPDLDMETDDLSAWRGRWFSGSRRNRAHRRWKSGREAGGRKPRRHQGR